MKNEKGFYRNLLIIFLSISVFFSMFIVKTGIEFSIFVMIVPAIIFFLYMLFMDTYKSEWKTQKKVLGMPVIMFFLFSFGFLFIFWLLHANLVAEDEFLKMKGFSMTFHFLLGLLAAIISWYKHISKLVYK